MPPAKKPEEPKKAGNDFGASEVQDRVEEAQEKGYFGEKVDPIDNKEYSLESGPDSPTVQEQRDALNKEKGD